MKRFLTLIALALTATAAYAACEFYTITTPEGRVLFCQKCCYYNNCTVTCN